MNKREMKFSKYYQRGSTYHWEQISLNPFRHNAFVNARYSLLKNLIIKQAKNDNVNILDVGCGDGVLLYLLSSKMKHATLYGIDSSEFAIEGGKNQLERLKVKNVHLDVQNAYDLKFQDNFFDIVVSSDVIEHLKSPDQMLSEIRRVLKPNGIAIIGTPIRITETPLDKNHYKEFFQKEFINFLNEYFKEIKLIETHDLFYYLLYQKYKMIRYLFNLLSIFNRNPFLKNSKNHPRLHVYMIGICKKPKK